MVNGKWNFTCGGTKTDINVPFCPESLLSGVNIKMEYGREMVYSRCFTVPEEWEGKRILSEAAVRYMSAPHLREDIRRNLWDSLGGYNYGCLVRVCDRPGECGHFASPGEYGWDGWLGTYFINLPKERITFLLNINAPDTGTSAVARKCRNILAAELG